MYKPDVLQLNCRALSENKINYIMSEFVDNDQYCKTMNFICICETWFQQSCTDELPTYFNNFVLGTHFSRSSHKGGGVGIWHRAGLQVKPIDLSAFCLEKHIEICCLCWHPSPRDKVLLISLYRSPSPVGNFDTFLQNLNDVLNFLHKPGYKILLNGDFNVDPRRDVLEYTNLIHLLSTFNLRMIIKEATRLNNTLDHLYVNYENCGQHLILDNCISDHRSILFQSNISANLLPEEKHSKLMRKYYLENINNFKQAIGNINWRKLHQCADIDEAYQLFYNEFQYHFNIHFPLKKVRFTRLSHKWVSDEVRKSSHNLRDLFMLTKKYPELSEIYTAKKQKHFLLLKNSKRRYYQSQVANSSNVSKTVWSIVRNVSNANHGHQKLSLNINNKIVSNPNQLANNFNDYFCKIAQLLVQKSSHSHIANHSVKFRNNFTLALFPFSEEELCLLIGTKLKNKYSAGNDEIPPALIKKIASALGKPLAILVNLSFASGKFPSQLKTSNIIPIYKKGDPSDMENYRPISLSSVFSKIFEYCYLDRLQSFAARFNLISSNQFGFQPKKSTTGALHSFYNRLVSYIDKGQYPVGIFCDLTKAFDCVNVDKLMCKLDRCGVRGLAHKWLESFLKNRKQKVVIDYCNNGVRESYLSQEAVVDIGVPQGSVLGPVLFLFYMNDIHLHLDEEAHCILYADDTSLLISDEWDKSLENICNKNLSQLYDWFSSNSLTLSEKKSNFIRFRHLQSNVQNIALTFNQYKLQEATSTKFLGLHIDAHLNWQVHCTNIVNKLNRTNYLFRNLRTIFTLPQLIPIYHASVASIIRYGICLWGPSPYSRCVFLSQKRIIRTLANIRKFDSCRGFFKKHKILTLTGLYIFEICQYIYVNSNKMVKSKDIHQYNIRGNDNLRPHFTKTKIGINSPSNLGIKIYNHLPHIIRNCRQLSIFKEKLYLFLVDKCHYDISEYFTV
uniref:Reverse transcriptase domain-containing protein n=1 Tax=Photinus pyralis TaxID=7054 RepID=A0A1Y1M8J8_PHOPY